MTPTRVLRSALVALIILAGTGYAVWVGDLNPDQDVQSYFLREFEPIKAPEPYLAYCRIKARDCAQVKGWPGKILTRNELERVNAVVNRHPYVTDQDQYGAYDLWAPLTDRGGDCEDYAISKLERLLALGWPRSALRLTIVQAPSGLPHMVLVAHMQQADFVLDIGGNAVLNWTAYPYAYWFGQDETGGWVRLRKQPGGNTHVRSRQGNAG